jgi:hypothetical protein
MAVKIIPNDYLPTLAKIVDEARENGEIEACRKDAESVVTVSHIQEALRRYGCNVSNGQAEEVYRMYSHNNWASWIVGGCHSLDDAVTLLKDFCYDIQFGENHIGL